MILKKSKTPGKKRNLEIYQKILEETNKTFKTRYVRGGHMAHNCLQDKVRTITLMNIVAEAGRKGGIAVDAGAGTGPLAFAFLEGGGDKVIAIEKSKDLCELLERLSRRLDLKNRIEIRHEDVLNPNIRLPKIDCIMAELVCSGLLSEPLVEAIKNLRRFAHEDTLYIPERAISKIALNGTIGPISNQVIYDEVILKNFQRERVETLVDLMCNIRSNDPDILMGVLIDTSLGYPNGRITGRFEQLCFPIHQTIHGKDGESIFFEVSNKDIVTLDIKYEYGGHETNIRLSDLQSI